MSIQSPVPYLKALFPAPKTDKTYVDVDCVTKPNSPQADQVVLSPRSPESTEREQERFLSRLTTFLRQNQLGEAKQVLARMADPDLKTGYRPPLLHVFAQENNEAVVKTLVQDFHRDVNATDDLGRNALHVLGNLQSSMAALMMSLGIDPNAWDENGKTPLHTAALMNKPVLTQALLRNPDIKPNRQDDYGNTPLHVAIEKGHLEIVKMLAQSPKTQLDLENFDDESAWDVAAKKGGEVFRVLKEAEVARGKQTPRKESSAGFDFEALFPKETITSTPRANRAELSRQKHSSSADGNKYLKKLPLKQDTHGNNALHRAAVGGNIGWVKLLTESLNPELSQRNADGKTAFQLAMQHGHQDIARFLLASPWREAQKK